MAVLFLIYLSVLSDIYICHQYLLDLTTDSCCDVVSMGTLGLIYHLVKCVSVCISQTKQNFPPDL